MHGMISDLHRQVHEYFGQKQELIDGEKMFLSMLSSPGFDQDDDEDRNSPIRISKRRALARKRRPFLEDMTFQLMFFGDWSFREIAAFCRCEVSTVSNRYYKGLERMYSRFPWAFSNPPGWMKKELKKRKKIRELME